MTGGKRLVQTRPTGKGRARGLVSSPESGRRVDAARYAPPDDLADVVDAFWMGCWDLRGQEPHETELLSDPCAHLVFEEGDGQPGGRLVGVWTDLWRRTLKGRGRVRGVKLRAGALPAFVDAPAHELTSRIVPLAQLFGDAQSVERAVLQPEDEEPAFAAFGDWLRSIRRRHDQAQIRLAIALVDKIAEDPEITSVEQLSAAAGLGLRSVQRLFRHYVGASPKWAIRRRRLQEVALRIERGDTPTLASLAAELGYTDQAHLARDFKNATGKSPSAFATLISPSGR